MYLFGKRGLHPFPSSFEANRRGAARKSRKLCYSDHEDENDDDDGVHDDDENE